MQKRERKLCYWCGRQMSNQFGRPNFKTREHLIPKAHGGAGENVSNIVFACYECNQRRGTAGNWVPFHEHRQVGQIVISNHARTTSYAAGGVLR